ncbi:MAG TPA: glycosyltransferase [Acidimicrobiales bacterium]|nr:glycosyltransferase [Acidimicrobiales bacterium]
MTHPGDHPAEGRPAAGPPVSVVIATRNRRERLLTTLGHLAALPERPPVIVVDNASSDGSAAAAGRAFPGTAVLSLAANEGAAARNAGARLATTPYVAFSDDDSWWEPGALTAAARALDADRRLGLLAASVVVGEDRHLDPTSAVMALCPLNADLSPLPGGRRGVLGFLACGAVVRRSAFLTAGGFPAGIGVGGEEEPVALAMVAMGWKTAYEPSVVAVHHPLPAGDTRSGRARTMVRNRLLTAWGLLPGGDAWRITAACLTRPSRWPAVADAARRLPAVVASRRPVPPAVAAARRRLAQG